MFNLTETQILFLVHYSMWRIIETSIETRLSLQSFRSVYGNPPCFDTAYSSNDRELCNKLKLNMRIESSIELRDMVVGICQDFRLEPAMIDKIMAQIFI